MLTGNNEDFDKYFIVVDKVETPTERVVSIIQELIDNDLGFDEVLQYARKQDYRRTTSDEVLKKYLSDYEEYYNFRKEAKNKVIVTNDDLQLASDMANAIKHGSYTHHYLENALFQKDLYTEEYKGLLDILQIKNNTARVVDVKTTGDYLERFPKSMFRFNYPVQLLFYENLVKYNYPDLEILPSIIIAVSTKEPDYAEPFQLSEETRESAQELMTRMISNYEYWTTHQYAFNKELKENGVNYV